MLLLKVVPQVLHLLVVLELGVALNVNNSHINVVPQQLVENKCKRALALVLGFHRGKQEVEPLWLLYEKRLEHMPPTEGEQTSLCLAQSLGKRKDAYAKRHKIIVLVNHQAQQAFVGHRQIHLHKLINLLWSERCKAVKVRVALVAQLKESLAVILRNLVT